MSFLYLIYLSEVSWKVCEKTIANLITLKARSQNFKFWVFAAIISVFPNETSRKPNDWLSCNLIFYYFWKSVEKVQIPFKSDKQIGQFTWRHIWIYYNISSVFFNIRNVSNTLCTEIKKHVMCSMVLEILPYFKQCKNTAE